MDAAQVTLLLVAGLAAGGVNALAGGGSLLTFPAMITVGLSPVQANVSNAIAVCPGYVAATAGSRADLKGQGRRTLQLMGTAVAGGVIGCALLLLTPSAAFETVVPFLVIGAALLLAFQRQVRGLVGHPGHMSARRANVSLHLMTGIGCIYGGYFGAALGVMLVACLALVLDESLARVSALKNVIAAVVGLVTVAIYAMFGPVSWLAVLIVSPATLVGGYFGAKLGRILPQALLRGFIVAFGVGVGIYLMLR